MNDVKKYFNSKDKLAEEEIGRDSLVIALSFKAKSGPGIYLSTKIKAEIDKFQALGPMKMGDDGQITAPFLLAGTGNYAEFEELSNNVGSAYVADAIDFYGDTGGLSSKKLESLLSQRIRSVYVRGRKAYGVEILLLSFLTPGIGITRIKYNGEPHPCIGYGLIGGYTKIVPVGKIKSAVSKRKIALEKLTKLYSSRQLPELTAVKKIAKEILDMEKDKGEMIQCQVA